MHPRLAFFGVQSRRDLARRAAAAAPGVRFATRRAWTDDPGEPRRRLLGGEPAVGLWSWDGTAEEFAAAASEVLLCFVHPLVGRGLPFCLGFPFGPEVLAPRHLGVGDAAALDLEDIGRLLRQAGENAEEHGGGVLAGGPPKIQEQEAGAAAGRQAGEGGGRRPAEGPDAVRLDDAQLAAVRHSRGPARVLAPAGSGKTKTLVSRVVELVDRGADPAEILMLAFNRKAAEQLEERLAALGIATTRRIGAPATDGGRRRHGDHARPRPAAGGSGQGGRPERPAGVHCATFNAFGYRYQREVLRARIALDHDGRSLRALMARAMETAGVSLREIRPRRGSDPVGAFMGGLARVRAALEPAAAVQVRLESLGETPLLDLPFAPVHAQYERAQTATGLQSFDDQIYFAVLDMLADPDHRAFIQARFAHVLVDEFQDLNGTQLALVDLLSRPHRRLFVVGDDDQLIYGWRQADPRGILEFHRRMPPKPWSATYTLGTNYRCSRAVVESGARLVANNVVREAKEIRPRAGAQDGAVRFFGAPSWPERATAMCAFLRSEKDRLDCEWRDLAVLSRYRSQQLLVALALDAGDVPRSPALGCTLFTHPAAELLRAYVDLLRAPDELRPPALAGLLNRPNRYLSAAVVEAVGTAARPWSHVRALAAREPSAGPRPLSALVELVETLGPRLAAGLAAGEPDATGGGRTGAGAGPDPAPPAVTSEDLVWTVVEAFALDDHWAAEADATATGAGPDGASPLEILDSLLLLAQTYPDPGACLAVWDRLRADEREDGGVAGADSAAHGAAPAGGGALTGEAPPAGEPDDDRVLIGTIHAAKGREYHSVVIPDYDCDISRWSAAEVEEERRVVYVGVTRARHAALFTVDTSPGFVHPFLRELVEPPTPGEHETLAAQLAEDPGGRPQELIAGRLSEIEVLFPELVPQQTPHGGLV